MHVNRLHPIFDSLNDKDAKRVVKLLAECEGPDDSRIDEIIDIFSKTSSPCYRRAIVERKNKKPTLVQTLNRFMQETLG